MPLSCRYVPDRVVPLSFNKNELFKKRPGKEKLQVILIESGCIALRFNQERFYLQSGALIFCNENTTIEKMFSQSLVAVSVAFNPEFININLSNERIVDEKYSLLCSAYGYPSFHLFYDWSNSYAGVLPLNPLVQPKASALFSSIIRECEVQPDDVWSCRARVNLLELFHLAEEEYSHLVGTEIPASPLAHKVLEYIHANYEREITVGALCELYHTNHTTLLRDFRSLTGTTINQYVVEYRLQLVKEALLFSSLSVEEIAEKFGFRQAAYLSRVFKARMGESPGQFRSRMVRQRKLSQGCLEQSRSAGSFQPAALQHG